MRAVALSVALVAVSGCSLKRMAVNSVAGILSEGGGTTFSSDEDPQLVREAAPFSLKLYETLLESVPENQGLLRATCSLFTQYAYAFVQLDAEKLEATDFSESMAMNERALKLYLRGHGYCMRALELRHDGVAQNLMLDPGNALAWAREDDVELLYWTGAAWGSAVSIGQGKPALVADVPAVKALMAKALVLDEDYGNGAIHAALISLEALPEAMGGSEERARQHFERALELSDGLDPGPYVTLAASISVANQNRAEFEHLLDQALAIDPEDNPAMRLPTIIAQDRARDLLARIDDLFLEAPSGRRLQ
jgi:predicted anti-sigma-YlaC factor YlaD